MKLSKYRGGSVTLRKLYLLECEMAGKEIGYVVPWNERRRLISDYGLDYDDRRRIWTADPAKTMKKFRKRFPDLKGKAWREIEKRYLYKHTDITSEVEEVFPPSELYKHDYTPPDRVRIAPYVKEART